MPDQNRSPRRWWVLFVAATLLTLGASGIHARKPIPAPASYVTGTGIVEADQTVITSALSGRLLQLDVHEGDAVKAGQLVAELDPTQLNQELGLAKASGSAPGGWLGGGDLGNRPLQVKVTATPPRAEPKSPKQQPSEDVRQESDLKAAVVTSTNRLALAEVACRQADDALKLTQQPPSASQIEEATSALTKAKDAVAKAQDHFERWKLLYNDGAISARAFDAAKLARDQAQQACDQAEARLKELHAGPNPDDTRTARESLSQANADLEVARKAAAAAKAAYADSITPTVQTQSAPLAVKPPTSEIHVDPAQLGFMWPGAMQGQLRSTHAARDLAQQAVDSLQAQINQTRIFAPVDAVVQGSSAHPGDQLNPGSPIVTLGDLDRLWVSVKFPGDEYGKVQPNQIVDVSVDGLPGAIFEGRVASVSSRAEVAPGLHQTVGQKLQLVLVAKVVIDNTSRRLTPGMSANILIHIR